MSEQFITLVSEIPDEKSEFLYDFIVDNLNFVIDKKRIKYPLTKDMKQCIGYCTKNKILFHPTKKKYYVSLNDCPIHPGHDKNNDDYSNDDDLDNRQNDSNDSNDSSDSSDDSSDSYGDYNYYNG